MTMIAAYARRACGSPILRPNLSRMPRVTFSTTTILKGSSSDKRAPHGVVRALQDASETPSPTLLESEFSLADRVALVTGANRGLGLEGALALAEAGARAVYCVDIQDSPGSDWTRVQEYVSRMRGKHGKGRLEYIRGDVSDQEQMWKIGKEVGDREGRVDVCLAAAGIALEGADSLRVLDKDLQKVLSVNLKGVLYTAQAAGQQMERFGNGGSMIFIASVAGHIALGFGSTSYEIAKSGVIQMGRSLACELAPKGIRVNTISPGYFQSPMLDQVFQRQPELEPILANENPVKRIGRPHELRGAIAWLASDASSFCTGSDVLVSGGHTAW